MHAPDFYLASSDSYKLKEMRRCWRVRRMAIASRNDLLLVRIDPPLLGQQYGLGARDIELVLIQTRHESCTLFPISEWPVYVSVARPLIDHPELCDSLQENQVESIAWAELYRTEKEAHLKVI